MQVIDLENIKHRLRNVNLLSVIEDGFVSYSAGTANIPPVGELQLEKGEVHIKYGAIDEQPFYVIKVASGFYGNAALGLPTGNGCMLVFSQETGALQSVLLDQGYLTDVRTGVAGAVAASYLAPKNLRRIGIVGTGIQARMQLRYLRLTTECKDVLVWGRSGEQAKRLREEVNADPDLDFQVEIASDVGEIQRCCNLIVTTTPAESPLLSINDLQTGTHITAVGSDTPSKQELDDRILRRADVVVADSISQCQLRGEISHALRSGQIEAGAVVELGAIASGVVQGRVDDDEITVADLTGVAVQDIQIATAVCSAELL